MTDAPKSPEVLQAESKLKTTERFRHAVSDAKVALAAAGLTGRKDLIESAEAALAAAEKAEQVSGITQEDIDAAAQALLDATGQSHTEENILPPDHGAATAEAEFDLAMARSRRSRPAVIEAKERALADAVAADEKERNDHIVASTKRTLANLEGAKS